MAATTTLQVWRDGKNWRQPHTEMLKPGDAGTVQALAYAAHFVREDGPRADVRRFVLEQMVGGVRGHDHLGEIRACHDYARDRIVYRRDPLGVERVADFWSVLRGLAPGGRPEGDCLLKSVVLATSLWSLQVKPYFAVIKQRHDDNGFRHVYVAVEWEGKELALDPTPPDARPGWEAGHLVKRYYEVAR